MRVALYKGISLTSRAIRFATRSEYSHAAFVLDRPASRAAVKGLANVGRQKLRFTNVGAVIEAWEPGGVRNVGGLGDGHAKGTVVDIFDYVHPLQDFEEDALICYLEHQLGLPYDFRNVLLFLPIVRVFGGSPDRRKRVMFCSRLVFKGSKLVGRKLLERKQDFEVPPDWIQMSQALRFTERHVCTPTPPYSLKEG